MPAKGSRLHSYPVMAATRGAGCIVGRGGRMAGMVPISAAAAGAAAAAYEKAKAKFTAWCIHAYKWAGHLPRMRKSSWAPAGVKLLARNQWLPAHMPNGRRTAGAAALHGA